MAAVVEFQGFTDNNNRFIVKELAIVSEHFQTQIVFKPPYCKCALDDKQQRSARWLIRHLHGIKWEEGSIEYNENLIRTLCKPFTKIYTKGLEKVNFLKEFHPNVIELPKDCSKDTCSNVCILPIHVSCNFKCAFRAAHQEYKRLYKL